jgi:hypothetical protein
VSISVGYTPVVMQFISPGAVWKYLDDGSNQGTAWAQPGYSDSAWSSGPARLGYGGDGEQTTVSFGADSANKYITTYFRHSLNVAADLQITNLTLRLQRDDGAIVRLNGGEIHRSNMPGDPISYTTLASAAVSGADEQTWFATDIPVNGLPSGLNVVAVEVHQSAANSSDLGFDLELIGTGFRANLPPPTLTTQRVANNRIRISWPTSAAGWSLYQAASLAPGTPWTPVSLTPAVAGNEYYVIVFTLGSQRYYRLQKS